MPRAPTAATALMDDAQIHSATLSCRTCPLWEQCGGLHCKANLVGCEELCCGGSVFCTTVCPRHPSFLQQFSEVGGFDLLTVPQCIDHPIHLPQKIVPLIYHGSSRAQPFRSLFIALRLSDLIDFRRRSSRFRTRQQLCDAFSVESDSSIIVTGVDHDPAVEAIWELGSDRRRVFGEIAGLGVSCATTPNFSMILDVPRHDNLHAMQKIAIVYSEMSNCGLATALHVNGRTEFDFIRWGSFLRARPNIRAIAYEFITGSGLSIRMPKHAAWLNALQEHAGRPLICVMRGNPAALDLLSSSFDVIYIETTSFVKTVKRQASIRFGNSSLRWGTKEEGEVSTALENNFSEVRRSLATRYPRLGQRI